jgi:hypothetical protein
VTIIARDYGRDREIAQLGESLRTTLSLGLDALADHDSGREKAPSSITPSEAEAQARRRSRPARPVDRALRAKRTQA